MSLGRSQYWILVSQVSSEKLSRFQGFQDYRHNDGNTSQHFFNEMFYPHIFMCCANERLQAYFILKRINRSVRISLRGLSVTHWMMTQVWKACASATWWTHEVAQIHHVILWKPSFRFGWLASMGSGERRGRIMSRLAQITKLDAVCSFSTLTFARNHVGLYS